MSYVFIAMIAVLMLCGCAKKESAEKMKQAEKETAAVEKQSKEATMEVKARMQETAEIEQKEITTQAAMKPAVEMPVPRQMAGSVTTKEEGGWGFSIYDPVANEMGYYTSNGMFLGREKR
jgi:hypothetical protein